MEFSGRLASVPVGDLLQWAHNDRRTGCLVVRTTRRQKRVAFDQGAIVACASDDPAEYFGQYLLLQGHLDQRQVLEVLTWCRSHQRRLGAALVELELLPASQVRSALRRQIGDAVCDLFLWPQGVFYFEQLVPAEEELLPEPIDAQALALEGSRWADELERIRSVFVHDNVVLRPGARFQDGAVTPLEGHVLRALEAPATLGALHGRVKGSHFRFLEAAFALTVREVLDIESVGDETGRTGSQEIRIFDLLLEQAAEEQVVFTSTHLSLPLEALNGCYPVWLEPATEAAQRAVAADAAVAELYREMDGSRSLRELVTARDAERERRMEVVLLGLRRGDLALLPRPLAELERERPPGHRWLRTLRRKGGR